MEDVNRKHINLKTLLSLDPMDYYPFLSKGYILDWLLKTEQYWLRRFMRNLRKEEYYTFHRPNKLLKYYYQRKKNRLGRKLGFFIPAGCFDSGLKIYHYGSIIVNPKARIGKNCTIHGNCCIRKQGHTSRRLPRHWRSCRYWAECSNSGWHHHCRWSEDRSRCCSDKIYYGAECDSCGDTGEDYIKK